MTQGNRLASALALLALAVAGCRSSSSTVPIPGGGEVGTRDYALVLLRTGSPPDDLDAAAADEAFAGHFAFMDRLADEGVLLLAGPFGDERAASDLRGVFVLDERDMERAAEIAAGDPTTRLGVFRQEVVPLRTLDLLHHLPPMAAAAEAAAGGSGEGPVLRSYCLVTAEDGARAARALGSRVMAEKLLLLGRLGGERDGELFAILDVERPALARPYVVAAAGGYDLGAEFSQWFATPALQTLAREGPPAAEGAADQDPPSRIDSSK